MKFPTNCPSCDSELNVHIMNCPNCSTQVTGNFVLPEFMKLTEEEQGFIIKFFLSSGNIKDMSKMYSISYPTMRNKIDDLIQKIQKSYESN